MIEIVPYMTGHFYLRFFHPRLKRRFELLIWLIVGGTPCISFPDFGESQRYPNVGFDRMPEGVTYLDVLPEGEETVYKYVEDHWAKHRRRIVRQRMMRRFFSAYELRQAAPDGTYDDDDREQMGFIGITHRIHQHYISGIHLTTPSFSGPLDAKHLYWHSQEQNFRPEEHYNLAYWFLLKSYIDSLPFLVSIADLTTAQWHHYLNLLLIAPKDVERGSREVYRKYFAPHAFDIIFPPHKSHRYGAKGKKS